MWNGIFASLLESLRWFHFADVSQLRIFLSTVLLLREESKHISIFSPSGQVVICGDPTREDTKELLQCVYSTYTPNRVRTTNE